MNLGSKHSLVMKFDHFFHITQAMQGKVHNHVCAPQQATKVHFRYPVIVHLKHKYGAPRFWAKKTLSLLNFKTIDKKEQHSLIQLS